jgi:hypothetical protein
MVMPNQHFFISFREGDSILVEGRVIMAVTYSQEAAEQLFLEYFKQNKLPAFTYHTAERIIVGNVLSSLTINKVHFVSLDTNEQKEAKEWKKIQEIIKKTPIIKTSVKEIYHEHDVV